MKTEIYTDPTAFLAAVNGKRKAKPRSARAAAGEGNRQAHLDKLAARRERARAFTRAWMAAKPSERERMRYEYGEKR